MGSGYLSGSTKNSSSTSSLEKEMSESIRKVEIILVDDPEKTNEKDESIKQLTALTDNEEKSDWKTLLKLLTCIVLVFLPCYTTAARISVFASDRHDNLSSTLVGGLISTTYLGALISSPIVGVIAPKRLEGRGPVLSV